MIFPVNLISQRCIQFKCVNDFLLLSFNRENDWKFLCRSFARAIPWPIFREEIKRVKFNRANGKGTADCKKYNFYVGKKKKWKFFKKIIGKQMKDR